MSAQAVVVGRGGELTTEIADGIIIEGDSQFQFNGHLCFVKIFTMPVFGSFGN